MSLTDCPTHVLYGPGLPAHVPQPLSCSLLYSGAASPSMNLTFLKDPATPGAHWGTVWGFPMFPRDDWGHAEEARSPPSLLSTGATKLTQPPCPHPAMEFEAHTKHPP